MSVLLKLGAALSLLTFAGSGCDLMPGKLSGDITENKPPIVEFANAPASGESFSYAPVIYWKGRDADGFVEYYEYADITDATAISDPAYFVPFIPEDAWVRTEAMSDTIYLLTEAGEVTEHVFYLRCFDDREESSEVIWAIFYRTNNPPRVPQIKWFEDPDYTYANDIPPPDSTSQTLQDTLYCLDGITSTWPGLSFVWRSSDPDDSGLKTIPLTFRYFLERVPHDTIWEWSSLDWTRAREVVFYGLSTGHYTFTVWARDDGFETSVRPATATFDVYRPTFEHSIVLLNTMRMDARSNLARWDLLPATPITDMYKEMVSAYPDADYFEYTAGNRLPKAFLGSYRLVIWLQENQTVNELADDQRGDLLRYVRAGGRLWTIGLLSLKQMHTSSDSRLLGLAQCNRAGPSDGVAINRLPEIAAELTSLKSGVNDLPDLVIDTARTALIYRERYVIGNTFGMGLFPLLPGVDILSTGGGAETAYYFTSYTDTATGDAQNERANVITNFTTSTDTAYFPPTPVECVIKLARNRVREVTRIENLTRGMTGTPITLTNNVLVGVQRTAVVRVSYKFGEPWSITDTLVVDYDYIPYSEFHLKPCAVRYEHRTFSSSGEGYEVGYRIAVFCFPVYYFDNSRQEVSRMFQSMLAWFFQPYVH